MSSTNINTAIRRFEAGGILRLYDGGSNDLAIKNMMPGTLQFKPPIRAKLPYVDRDVQQAPVEGADTIGEVMLEIRAGAYDATSLQSLIMANGTTTAKLWSMDISIPTYRGEASPQKLTLSNVYLDEAPAYKAGTDFDVITIKAKFNTYTASA